MDVRAVDYVGNETTNSINVIIDLGGARVSFSAPVSNAHYKGNALFSGNTYDDTGVVSVEYSLDGLNWTTLVSAHTQTNYPWEVLVSTTNYLDGFYYFYIRAKDTTSIQTISSMPFYINNNISNIIYYPLNGSAVNGIEALQGTVITMNPAFISNLKITMNTNGESYITSNLAPAINFVMNFDTTDLPSFTVLDTTVVLHTYSGLSFTNYLTNYVDKSLPIISNIYPTNGSYMNLNTFTFWGTATDDTGIKEAYISFDNNAFGLLKITNNGSVSYWHTNINTADLVEGNNEMYVTVYDLNGKSKTLRTIFTLDKTLPTITVSTPADNTTLGTNFIISASASDNNFISSFFIEMDSVRIASNMNPAATSFITYPFVTNLSGEGIHILDFIAYDSSGNLSTKTLTIAINENPARSSNITIASPANAGNYTRGTLTIAGTSYDATLSNVFYQINSNAWVHFITNSPNSTTNWTFTVNSATLPEGLTTLNIRAVDSLGGFTVFTTNFYVDNTPPMVSVVGFDNYDALGGTVSIQTMMTDNISLANFQAMTNGTVNFTNVAISTGTLNRIITLPTWDLTAFADGVTNFIILTAVDKVNLSNTATNFFIVSNLIPSIIVSNLVSGDYVSSNLFVEGITYENSEGISGIQLKLGTNAYANASVNNYTADKRTNHFTHTINAKTVAQGPQTLLLRATSSNGSFSTKSLVLNVDYEPPVVNITSPTNGNSYYGTLYLSGTATDNYGMASLVVSIETNNLTVTNITLSTASTNWSTNWDTTALPVGNINVILKGTDLAGNESYKTNAAVIRPYISSLSTYSTWTGNSLTVNGQNFGTSSVVLTFAGGATLNSAGGSATARTENIPLSPVKSGYFKISVNGIESINSNWLDLWTYQLIFTPVAGQINSRFVLGPNNKLYYVQSQKSGNTWATNFLISDYTGSIVSTAFVGSTIPNGEIVGVGNAIEARSNMVVTAYSPAKMTGIWVTVFTNNVRITNVKIDTFTLQNGGDSDALMDIRIDSSLGIHVVYSDFSGGNIKYAKSTDYGTTWVVENAVTGLTYDAVVKDAQPSVDVDSVGNPHIVYFDAGIEKLRLAVKSGGTWSIETVDTLQLNGLYSDIQIDANNTIHVSYYNGDQGDLLYSYKTAGGSWSRTLIDYAAITGYYTSIDVYGNERAISYFSASYNNPYLSYFNGVTWRIVSVPMFPAITKPYGKYGGVGFIENGSEIWMGFVETTGLKLWIAKYLKP